MSKINDAKTTKNQTTKKLLEHINKVILHAISFGEFECTIYKYTPVEIRNELKTLGYKVRRLDNDYIRISWKDEDE